MSEIAHPIDFLSGQAFIVDPRGQGFGLSEYPFLDGYANKFYILSDPNGCFISPRTVPGVLTDYYDRLGIAAAPRDRLLALPPEQDTSTLAQRVEQSHLAKYVVGQTRGNFVVPYMATEEVEALANKSRRTTLARAGVIRALADKEVFQLLLADISPAIKQETGLDVGIPSAGFASEDRAAAKRAYHELSRRGQKSVVVIKPKSASALGIFVLDANQGFSDLERILDTNFAEGERVLLEAFVEHNHSPSMQGFRTPDSSYDHLYMSRQFISMKNGQIEYDASQIPFDTPGGPINKEAAARMLAVHNALGELVIVPNDIAGVGGFDSLVQTDDEGNIIDLKLTELNLHLPSSFAVYAATHKLSPEGFTGIAFNCNVPLRPRETFEQFMQRNAQTLVQDHGQYGVLPLNGSFTDKVDVILFARDEAHLAQLQTAVI